MTQKFLLVLLLGSLSAPGWADTNPADEAAPGGDQVQGEMKNENPKGREGRGHHRRPPKEALDACQGKASEAECSFTGRGGEAVSGKCWSPKSSLPLACRPSKMQQ